MSRNHYDAVIIGSGFGGSVMAYRLAEAGLRVCLLERGKAYPPGSFARTPYQMRNNFWDPSEGHYGLYNIWSFQNLNAVVSSGLGGGSLIYSNVMLRKDEKWFVHEKLPNGDYEYWPVTRAELDPHYDRVEKMLQVQRFPFAHSPYKRVGRAQAFQFAAEKLNLEWELPKQAITFGNADEIPAPGIPIHEQHENIHGPNAKRSTCRLCGECNVGCNYGSKNSLDYNYLSEARRLGAEILTGCEARSFHPYDGGYSISYVKHDIETQEGHHVATHDPDVLPLRTITADRLILSAGTFGTAFLLFNNLEAFPALSPRLGKRFSANGDFLALAMKCSDRTSGKRLPRVIDASFGPVITSTIRIPDAIDGGVGRGFYLQDEGYPNFLNWILQIFDTPVALANWLGIATRLVTQWLRGEAETDISAEIARLLGNSELSAGLFPMGGMGRDVPTGRLHLHRGRLNADWNERDSDAYYDQVREQMHAISDVLGAQFMDDSLWPFNRVITVHPLGGCSMGRDSREGVVNSYGEVFNYPGLYIADGSVMPGPIGANPSLTIAALADRFADGIIEDHKAKTQIEVLPLQTQV